MEVKVVDYDEKYIGYDVRGLTQSQMDYLDENLDEKTDICDGVLNIEMYFSKEMHPFQSDVAKIRLDDFISREEIEMNVFLSSFLEDM